MIIPKNIYLCDMCNRKAPCLKAEIQQRINLLKELGGIRCGTMRTAVFKRAGDGWEMIVQHEDKGTLLELDILVRLNSLN